MTIPSPERRSVPAGERRAGRLGWVPAALSVLGALALLGCEAYGIGEPARLWPYSPPTATGQGSAFGSVQGRNPDVATLPPASGLLLPAMPADSATVGVFQQGGEDGVRVFLGNTLAREVAVTYRLNGGPEQTVHVPALQAVAVGTQGPGEVVHVDVLRTE